MKGHSNILINKLTVIRFLRRKGYIVTLHPEERETLIVNGKRAYIKLSMMQKGSENNRKKWNPQPAYAFVKPLHNKQMLEYDNCYLVLLDRPNYPLYEIRVENTPYSPQITADLKTKYPISFIGSLREQNSARMNNWKKMNRANGKFASTKNIRERGGEEVT